MVKRTKYQNVERVILMAGIKKSHEYKQIKIALEQLGYDPKKVEINKRDGFSILYNVFLEGIYFGVFDIKKNTFID